MSVAVTALPSQSKLVAPLRALVALVVKAEKRKLRCASSTASGAASTAPPM
jgi:hypothetical protein